jgi:hypothetical protein
MIRLPKSLVALVMSFALLVQASAGAFCSSGCGMGGGNPHPSSLRSHALSLPERNKVDCCGKPIKEKPTTTKNVCKCSGNCKCPKVSANPAVETIPVKLTLPLGFDLLFLVHGATGSVAFDVPTDDIAIVASDSGPPGDGPCAVFGSRAPPVE